MTSKDKTSCPICHKLFTDARRTGKQNKECPMCSGDSVPIEVSKHTSVEFGDPVDCYKEQANCFECHISSNSRVCHHCKRPLCTGCMSEHLENLRGQLDQRVWTLMTSLNEVDENLEPLRSARDFWTKRQADLMAALKIVNSHVDELNSKLQSRLDAIHTAKDSLTVLRKTAPTDTAQIDRNFATASQHVESLAVDSADDCELPVENAERLRQLISDLLPIQKQKCHQDLSQTDAEPPRASLNSQRRHSGQLPTKSSHRTSGVRLMNRRTLSVSNEAPIVTTATNFSASAANSASRQINGTSTVSALTTIPAVHSTPYSRCGFTANEQKNFISVCSESIRKFGCNICVLCQR